MDAYFETATLEADDRMVVCGHGGPSGTDRLYSGRAVARCGDVLVTAFGACVSSSGAALREVLRSRMGAARSVPRVEEGFDDLDPFNLTMVPPVLSDEIVRVAEAPGARAHRDYSVFVERRFVV